MPMPSLDLNKHNSCSDLNRSTCYSKLDEKLAFDETSYLNSIPGLADSILKASAEPLDECVDENEVNW